LSISSRCARATRPAKNVRQPRPRTDPRPLARLRRPGGAPLARCQSRVRVPRLARASAASPKLGAQVGIAGQKAQGLAKAHRRQIVQLGLEQGIAQAAELVAVEPAQKRGAARGRAQPLGLGLGLLDVEKRRIVGGFEELLGARGDAGLAQPGGDAFRLVGLGDLDVDRRVGDDFLRAAQAKVQRQGQTDHRDQAQAQRPAPHAPRARRGHALGQLLLPILVDRGQLQIVPFGLDAGRDLRLAQHGLDHRHALRPLGRILLQHLQTTVSSFSGMSSSGARWRSGCGLSVMCLVMVVIRSSCQKGQDPVSIS
jgi:hypothetical protein